MIEKEYMEEEEKWSIDKTLSVKDLIEVLEKHPKYMKIFITWESTINPLGKENIYVTSTGRLYFDADGNFYKEDFQKEEK